MAAERYVGGGRETVTLAVVFDAERRRVAEVREGWGAATFPPALALLPA